MKVLVADKNPYDLDAMVSELGGPEVEVVSARDGREVVVLAARHRPDVVVVAASLGQMGGFAVSRELKMVADQERVPPPRVVVILEREADSWLAAWCRCDAFRAKPVSAEELRAMVFDGPVAGESEPTTRPRT